LIRNPHRAEVTDTLHAPSMTPPGPDPQECFAQIGRLVASPLLARSETLCKLLQYLADCTLNSPADHLKEYQIATEGLGRPADFDPQLDAGVRVHAGRLRSKLAEYYSSTGIGDSIVIDIPKGCYALSFERRAVPHEPMPLMSPMADVAAVAVGLTEPSGIRPRLVSAGTILVGVLLATGFGLYFYHYRAAQLATRRAAADLRPTAAQTFWSPFLHGPEETIVVFSNAIFVGNSETGLRYFDSSRVGRGSGTGPHFPKGGWAVSHQARRAIHAGRSSHEQSDLRRFADGEPYAETASDDPGVRFSPSGKRRKPLERGDRQRSSATRRNQRLSTCTGGWRG